jgi:hypothetical protein
MGSCPSAGYANSTQRSSTSNKYKYEAYGYFDATKSSILN